MLHEDVTITKAKDLSFHHQCNTLTHILLKIMT